MFLLAVFLPFPLVYISVSTYCSRLFIDGPRLTIEIRDHLSKDGHVGIVPYEDIEKYVRKLGTEGKRVWVLLLVPSYFVVFIDYSFS